MYNVKTILTYLAIVARLIQITENINSTRKLRLQNDILSPLIDINTRFIDFAIDVKLV